MDRLAPLSPEVVGPGLGMLGVKSRAARTGRNPATGEPIQIKASKKVGFRPAKELKEAN
jgi:DNA-binding protein HU-beta